VGKPAPSKESRPEKPPYYGPKKRVAVMELEPKVSVTTIEPTPSSGMQETVSVTLLVDPETGLSLGFVETRLGVIESKAVGDTYSVAVAVEGGEFQRGDIVRQIMPKGRPEASGEAQAPNFVEESVSAKRPLRLGYALGAVEVITAEEVQRSGARTLLDALRLIPSLFARTTPVGMQFEPRLFGSSPYPARTLVLFDGRPWQGPDGGGSPEPLDLDAFPLEHVARIEVMRSPNPILYGGAATFGVVNIITNKDGAGLGSGATHLEAGSRGTRGEETAEGLPYKGNPGTGPERVVTLEGGAERQFSPNLYGRLDLLHTHISGFVSERPEFDSEGRLVRGGQGREAHPSGGQLGQVPPQREKRPNHGAANRPEAPGRQGGKGNLRESPARRGDNRGDRPLQSGRLRSPLASGSNRGRVEPGRATRIEVVMASTVARVGVTPRNATVRIGETLHLSATAYDSQGRELQGATFVWSSSDESVATMNPRNGKVTGTYTGKATITATEADSGERGTAIVLVTD